MFKGPALCLLALTLAPSAWAAKRIRKARVAPPIWFASLDLSYSHWMRPAYEGGGESQAVGASFGFYLPWNASVFARVGYAPEPVGFQDTRVGISSFLPLADAWRGSGSLSLTLPTSRWSREIAQRGQSALSLSLEFNPYPFGSYISFYGVQAYYSKPAEIIYEDLKLLKTVRTVKRGNSRPAPQAPVSSGSPDENEPEPYYEQVYFGTRFHQLYSGTLGASVLVGEKFLLETSASISKSLITLAPDVWTASVTILQVSYLGSFYSVFAGGGYLDEGSALHWPTIPLYTAGVSTSVPN